MGTACTLLGFREVARADRPYYLVSNGTEACVITDPSSESQLIRRVVADSLKWPAGYYDWGVHQDEGLFYATLELFDDRRL